MRPRRYRNPTGWETDVRALLREMSGGDVWKGDDLVPTSWTRPYLARKPEWNPLNMASHFFDMSPGALLEKIKPEAKVMKRIEGSVSYAPDAEFRILLYEYVKDFLTKNGQVNFQDMLRIAAETGLTAYSTKSSKTSYVQRNILKKLLKEGLITQVSPTGFKGAIYYQATPKLLLESPAEKLRQRAALEQEEFEKELELERQERERFAALEQAPLVIPVEKEDEPEESDVESESGKKIVRRYTGDPNKVLSQIIKDYGLSIEQGAKHKLVRMPDNGMISIPGTPSDWRSMRNCVADVKRYLRKLDLWEGAKKPRRKSRRNPKRNPWSARDVVRHNKKCAKKTKCRNKWSRIANAVLRSTGDEGKAVRIANWQVNRMGLKRNPDERLRQLGRRSDDPVRLLLEKERAGLVSPKLIELAAATGDEVALQLYPQTIKLDTIYSPRERLVSFFSQLLKLDSKLTFKCNIEILGRYARALDAQSSFLTADRGEYLPISNAKFTNVLNSLLRMDFDTLKSLNITKIEEKLFNGLVIEGFRAFKFAVQDFKYLLKTKRKSMFNVEQSLTTAIDSLRYFLMKDGPDGFNDNINKLLLEMGNFIIQSINSSKLV